MSQTLTLDVPDDVYAGLAAEATASGKSVAEVAGDRLAIGRPGDLLLRNAGTFDLGPDDVSTRHHDYLSQAHLDPHDGAGP